MSKPQLVEAVMSFTEDGSIGRQMFYTEFEALLDGLARMPVFADQQVRLVYVVINARLQIRCAVFFYLDFDESGAPDSGWNIPLQQIAERAGRGPDLGAGPIRLACRSQCPVSWHQMHLWDPNLASGSNDLATLRDAVKRNGLGILLGDEDAAGVAPERLQVASEDRWYAVDSARAQERKLAERLSHDYRQKAAQLVIRQRERLARLKQEQRVELARVAAEAARQVTDMQAQIQVLRQTLQQQEALALRFRSQLAAQQRERDELAARSHEAVVEEPHVRNLGAGTAPHSGTDRLLQRLVEQGVVFVVFHPGAGHLSVPLEDVDRYLASPVAYAASRCSVSEALYRQWLEHYQWPRCEALQADGERCHRELQRIATPGRFVDGDSNRCAPHKAVLRRTPD
ncbi:hypothetical protein SAMN05216588_104221 [Pseudomonas flavescens]|uniref:Chromosome partitioning protein ParA n=1 Tax=Phytopseudomonas flavescens TaxID=29435 RepID=A0A1G8C0F2_9GAMM|nr:chromosome partitioning protein ParA [Pseudomonas flavescens]SDH38844.1 hypothetical protein SAMN05216588_104221 [Pseudomonas flavescens]